MGGASRLCGWLWARLHSVQFTGVLMQPSAGPSVAAWSPKQVIPRALAGRAIHAQPDAQARPAAFPAPLLLTFSLYIDPDQRNALEKRACIGDTVRMPTRTWVTRHGDSVGVWSRTRRRDRGCWGLDCDQSSATASRLRLGCSWPAAVENRLRPNALLRHVGNSSLSSRASFCSRSLHCSHTICVRV